MGLCSHISERTRRQLAARGGHSTRQKGVPGGFHETKGWALRLSGLFGGLREAQNSRDIKFLRRRWWFTSRRTYKAASDLASRWTCLIFRRRIRSCGRLRPRVEGDAERLWRWRTKKGHMTQTDVANGCSRASVYEGIGKRRQSPTSARRRLL